jgi:uncharacterized protein
MRIGMLKRPTTSLVSRPTVPVEPANRLRASGLAAPAAHRRCPPLRRQDRARGLQRRGRLPVAEFFHTNPLHRSTPTVPAPADHECHHAATAMRAPWFAVPCCRPNLARLTTSLGAYVATADAQGVQLHQYATGTVRAGEVTLSVRTDYPWDGRIDIGIEETPDERCTLTLRVPAWAQGATLDGEPVAPDPRIDAVRGCVAVERGPLVYCAESLDGPDLEAITVEPGHAEECGLGGVVCLDVTAREVTVERDGEWPYDDPPAEHGARRTLTLIPYHVWANRSRSTMRVWMPV